MFGKPQSGILSSEEKSVLREAGISLLSDEVMSYPSLCLSNGNVIVARSKSRMTKRNNSCLRYVDKAQTRCWGILEKIFSFNTSTTPSYFCLLSRLLPVFQLCTDEVTCARLQDHFVACQPLRLVLCCHIHFIS